MTIIQELKILFENDDVVVVDKPAGILVHPSGKPGQANLLEHLRRHKDDPEIRPVHRLDRQTSGVVLFARSAEVARFYGRLFTASTPRKTYLAEVRGSFGLSAGTTDKPLGKDASSRVAIRRCTVPVGESAITHFRCLSASAITSLIWLNPATGRRHQLRVHMADMGHAIVNDPIYDLGDAYYLALRYSDAIAAPMHLHAHTLEIALPDGQIHTFAAPLPPFIKNFPDFDSRAILPA